MEDVVHFLAGLKPLLLRIQHSRGVVQVLRRRQTQQVVVGFGILLVYEVCIIGTNQFDAVFVGQFNEHLIGLLLHGECLAIGTDGGVFHFVALQLQIVVVAKYSFMPLNGFAGAGNVAVQYLLGHFASNTCRADDEALMVLLQILAVSTWTHIETVHPRTTHQFDEIFVAGIVLGQHDEVVTTLVFLVIFQQFRPVSRHIHLATEDGLEGF